MAKSKLEIMQAELRERLQILEEDLNDSHTGDEYNFDSRKEQLLGIKFIKKTLARIWDLKHG